MRVKKKNPESFGPLGMYGLAAANANVNSVGDTSKKYFRKNRAADFAHEQQITQQLNQQASAAASPTVR